jgi:hypothetical protein
MSDELEVKVEGSFHRPFRGTIRCLAGRTQKNHNLTEDSRSRDPESYPGPPRSEAAIHSVLYERPVYTYLT